MAEYRKGKKVDPRAGLTDCEERAGLTREQAEAHACGGTPPPPPKPGPIKGRHRALGIAAAAVVGGILLLIVLAVALSGGGDGSSKGKSSETHAAAPPPPRSPGDAANLWIDADGGSCSRSIDPTAYSDPAACSSFAAAYSASSGGDTVRIKAGSYNGPQSVGSQTKTPVVNFIGEDGTTVVTTHDTQLNGLAVVGNATVSNVNVGGDMPFVFIGRDNSTWRDSRLLAAYTGPDTTRIRGGFHGATPEPILIYGDHEDDPYEHLALVNVVVEPQRACCTAHLESVRIDQNVSDVLIDRVTFLPTGPEGDNTARLFITHPGGASYPRNITIRNSVFFAAGGSYSIDGGAGAPCSFTFAYNTFAQERNISCNPGGSVLWVGNVGPKSSNGIACTPNTTWRKNAWQWDGDPRVCSGEAANETWLNGSRYSISAAGLDSNYRPLPGAAVIDKGEASCITQDRDGNPRPVGAACDAGAFERQG